MKNYSGTYMATLVMFVVPALVNVGFTESCANEILAIGVPALTGVALVLWRWAKGGVRWTGVRES
jgi:hypothetical protein